MKMHHTALLAALLAMPALAADNADLRALRDEVAQLRDAYEKRIADLEKRLVQAESKAASAETVALKAESTANTTANAPSPAAAGAPSGSNAFNPDVSLILSGLYSHLGQDPANYRVTGFPLPNATLDDLRPQRGFSLGESELMIAANIDHLFYGAMNLAVHGDNTVSTEEAFVQTTALPAGLTLKAGRFFSGIGYLNEQHAHTWDFVDAPLAYRAFLGGQFGNDGVQMRWLAPTDTYLELGAEAGRGANYPGSEHDRNGAGASAVFAHVGGDVGISNSWRAGLSWLSASPRDRQADAIDRSGTAVSNSFSGSSRLWIADGVWKWAPNGNANSTYVKLQGEYLRRRESGELSYDINGASLGTALGDYSAAQSGWYLQGVYQFAPTWRVGLRGDRLNYGSNGAALASVAYAPISTALIVDYNPSEFSRIRLQFEQDKSRQGFTDNQIYLQYQMSIGTHGAHKY